MERGRSPASNEASSTVGDVEPSILASARMFSEIETRRESPRGRIDEHALCTVFSRKDRTSLLRCSICLLLYTPPSALPWLMQVSPPHPACIPWLWTCCCSVETLLWIQADWQDYCHWPNTAEWTSLILNCLSFLWFVLLKRFDVPCHAVFETQRILNKIRIPAEPRSRDAKGIASAAPGWFPFTGCKESVFAL